MPAICFDLDGTLSDSRPGIINSIQYALAQLDHQLSPADDLIWCIGPPLLESFEQMLGSRERAEAALRHYRQRFGEAGLYENELYPGIENALASLSGAGYRMFVATSKPEVFARRIVEHFALSRYFEAIYGAGLDGTRERKSDLLAWIARQERLEPSSTVMVGDRHHDIVGARSNGMRSLGVLYGYGSREELESAGPDGLCERPGDLTLHIEQLDFAAKTGGPSGD